MATSDARRERNFTRAVPALADQCHYRVGAGTWRRAFSTQALSHAHRARRRRPPLSRPDRPKRPPCARGRAVDGRRAEVNIYAIAAVGSQLTMTPWTLTAWSVM